MDRMEEPVLARVAGESFAMITGADLSHDDLERDAPPAEATPTPDGEPADDVPAHDPDEHLPWPDAALVRAWWNREGRRFARGTRHLRGRPIGAAACKAAWQEGQQRQRRAAAYELKLMEAPRRCRTGTTEGDAALSPRHASVDRARIQPTRVNDPPPHPAGKREAVHRTHRKDADAIARRLMQLLAGRRWRRGAVIDRSSRPSSSVRRR